MIFKQYINQFTYITSEYEKNINMKNNKLIKTPFTLLF